MTRDYPARDRDSLTCLCPEYMHPGHRDNCEARLTRDSPAHDRAIDYVWRTVRANPGLTAKDIRARTGLGSRTIWGALQALAKRGEVERRPSLRDARQSHYYPGECST